MGTFSDNVTSYLWQRSGYLRTSLGQSIWDSLNLVGGVPSSFRRFLTAVDTNVAAFATTTPELTAMLPSIAPTYTPTGNSIEDQEAAVDALGGGAIPPQEQLVAFRAWATLNAAGGAVTLPAYVGTIATDDIGAIIAWVQLAS